MRRLTSIDNRAAVILNPRVGFKLAVCSSHPNMKRRFVTISSQQPAGRQRPNQARRIRHDPCPHRRGPNELRNREGLFGSFCPCRPPLKTLKPKEIKADSTN